MCIANKDNEEKLTHARLKELLHYAPATGVFTWRESSGRAIAGAIAGSVDSTGYIRIKISKTPYKAHRLAHLYSCGAWPIGVVDHIDGCRNNNVLANLRDVPHSENIQNVSRANKNSVSGHLGVHWHKHTKRWVSKITTGNTTKTKYFHTLEEAIAARKAAELIYFPTKPQQVAA